MALDELSLEVPAGSIFGLLGPNGSGKSTLLSLIIARREAAAGSIDVLGSPLDARLRRRMGIVFQEPSLDANMTVGETMLLQGRLFGQPRDETRASTAALLARVGLAGREGAFTSTLSGGMKRRLEVARALLTSPEVLLLDEPTLALDPDSRLALWDHLREASTAGATLLLATNDVSEAERYCDTVALIAGGRLVAQGAPAELKRDLRREAVRVEWNEAVPEIEKAIAGWPGAGEVRTDGRTTHVTTDDASALLARLFERHGPFIHAVRVEQSTLEDVYFQLAGRGVAPGQDGA